MQSKYLLIAIAAFAVATTDVHAYVESEELDRLGFTPVQIEALAEARELKNRGEANKARNVLFKAGIDEEKIVALRELRNSKQKSISESVNDNDYNAFLKAIKTTPLVDIINDENEFQHFRYIHDQHNKK